MSKNTVTLTTEQMEKITYLQNTVMSGEKLDTPKKTFEEITWQIVERGIASIEQTRKQYARTRLAVKAYKG